MLGWTHGSLDRALLLVAYGCRRGTFPWPLLAATVSPLGPVGITAASSTWPAGAGGPRLGRRLQPTPAPTRRSSAPRGSCAAVQHPLESWRTRRTLRTEGGVPTASACGPPRNRGQPGHVVEHLGAQGGVPGPPSSASEPGVSGASPTRGPGAPHRPRRAAAGRAASARPRPRPSGRTAWRCRPTQRRARHPGKVGFGTGSRRLRAELGVGGLR